MCVARDRKPGFDSEFTGIALKIKLRGEIDHHSAVAVRSAMDTMIRSKLPKELIVDMSAVDFMDSSGLGLIMGRYNTMKEIGGEIKVADPSPGTEKIMRLAGMERIVKVIHTAESPRKAATVKSVAGAGQDRSERAVKNQGEKQKKRKKEDEKEILFLEFY